MKTIQALNGKDDQFTLTALNRAASKATGQARATIQGLIRSLSSTTAARGRSAKELPMKKHHKRATKKARKSNPTAAPKAYKVNRHGKHHTTKHNPTAAKARPSFSGKLNMAGIIEVAKEGALVAAGSLGSSFAQRQAERLLPDFNPTLRTILATGALAGGALYFGGKTFGKPIAVGAIAEGIRSLGQSFMPELFAGVDGNDVAGVTGYWDENGQWVDAGVSGLTYPLGYAEPTLPIRPAGL
ncbi:hypothetical protein [Geothrix campi]|uniref:hypothetical protein n=1 Tax=Geothrix campi TaxID=2966450 RepID=UPI0021480CE5|nr:hypothetical protein [Geothrix sp. SG10]